MGYAQLISIIPPRLEAQPVREALQSVSSALRTFPDRGMIIGGVAVIARGVQRSARDIHATLATARELHLVFVDLERHGLVPRMADYVELARAHQLLLLRHAPTGVDVDLSLAWLPFELDALAAAEDVMLGTVELTVARAEDLVLYAAAGWSPHDRVDAERLLALHAGTMDLDRVRRIVADFAEAYGDPERLSEIENMIDRALGA